MVNESKQVDSLRLQDSLEFFYRLVYRVIASYVDDTPLTLTERHRCLVLFSSCEPVKRRTETR